MNKTIKELVISSPSRLHLGFYGLDDNYGYTFGSMGLAIDEYQTKLSINKSKRFSTNLPKKYIMPILKYLEQKNIKNTFMINILSSPPSHIGLGSGSQLSLCIGKLIFNYLGLDIRTEEIVEIFKRGKRSGTGIGIFENGGFIVDSCKKINIMPKTMFRTKFPKGWKIILINDRNLKGISGDKEMDFFSKNIEPHKKNSSELSHIVLRGILPSIVYEDFDNFSKNITEFQRMTALFYKNKQDGMFLSPEISKIMRYISGFDNIGVGQSSWGPMSYIFVESKLHAKELISVIENKFNVYNDISFKITNPCNSGYKIRYK